MRVVLQRVREARVEVGERVTGSIGRGLVALVGISRSDVRADADYLVDKAVSLRIFPDEEGKMNRSLLDIGGAMLVVSQFTLYGDARKGRRPGFDRAAPPEAARSLYEHFIDSVRARKVAVQSGIFQAAMAVHLVNDGPVTIILDSEKTF
jgi:D-aminoacyl-tRNA deacylase